MELTALGIHHSSLAIVSSPQRAVETKARKVSSSVLNTTSIHKVSPLTASAVVVSLSRQRPVGPSEKNSEHTRRQGESNIEGGSSPTISEQSGGKESSALTGRGQNGREPNKAEEEQQKTEEKKVVRELQIRDREVRAHEQAHASVLGPYKKGGPKYQFERGPDGRQYAVGGSVPVDLSPEKTPEETRRKAQTIRRAALAPKDPSGADFQVAAKAAQMEAAARAEISKERKSDKTDPASSSPNEIEDSSNQDEGTRPESETDQISQIDVSAIVGGGLTAFSSKLGTLTYSTSGQQSPPPVEPGQGIDFIV